MGETHPDIEIERVIRGGGLMVAGRAGAVILWLMDVNCRSQSCRALHTDELPHNCVFVQAALCKQKTRFVKIVVDRSGGNSVVFQIFCDCDDEGLTINNCGRWGFRLCEASDCEHFEFWLFWENAPRKKGLVSCCSQEILWKMFLKNVHWVT